MITRLNSWSPHEDQQATPEAPNSPGTAAKGTAEVGAGEVNYPTKDHHRVSPTGQHMGRNAARLAALGQARLDAIVRRARFLHARRIWSIAEIQGHLADEGVTVGMSCLKAWQRGDTRRDVGGMG